MYMYIYTYICIYIYIYICYMPKRHSPTRLLCSSLPQNKATNQNIPPKSPSFHTYMHVSLRPSWEATTLQSPCFFSKARKILTCLPRKKKVGGKAPFTCLSCVLIICGRRHNSPGSSLVCRECRYTDIYTDELDTCPRSTTSRDPLSSWATMKNIYQKHIQLCLLPAQKTQLCKILAI